MGPEDEIIPGGKKVPGYKGMNGKVTIHTLDKYGNVVDSSAFKGEPIGFTAENPSPVDPNSSAYDKTLTFKAFFKGVDPEAVKIIAGNSTNVTWDTADSKKILEDVVATKKSIEEQYKTYLQHLSKYAPEYTVDEYGNVHAVTEPAPRKKKMPKIKKDYVVGDRVEAVREFGKTGIKEGHKGTIVKLYADTQRPLIVQWDDHAVSHSKEWNYPYKDVRPSEFIPGEPTEYSLF